MSEEKQRLLEAVARMKKVLEAAEGMKKDGSKEEKPKEES